MTTPPTLSNALSFGLQGRVVIVTGAANGIGEACARRFAAEAAHVVLADVNSERGAAVAAELRSAGHSAGFMACDVSRKADVDALVDHVLQAFGRLDVLVNNAGIFKAADFLDVTEEDFDAVINVNIKGSFLMGQAAARASAISGWSSTTVWIDRCRASRGHTSMLAVTLPMRTMLALSAGSALPSGAVPAKG